MRAGARAAHGALAVAFLLALVSGGRWPWLHIPAGVTVGLLAWAGLLGWATGAFAAGQPARFRIVAAAGSHRLFADSAALLICLAAVSATGLARWLTSAGDSWALAHEGFRLAALGLLAAHLLRVVRKTTRHSGQPEPTRVSARAPAPSGPRETAE
jgi:hypothetical protein